MEEEKKEVKHNELEASKAEKVTNILAEVEKVFGVDGESKVAAVMESHIVNKPRDKQLKGTKSWSTNCLIRLYYSHSKLKESKKMPDFIKEIKQSQEMQATTNDVSMRIENSGYLTFVDMDKDTAF